MKKSIISITLVVAIISTFVGQAFAAAAGYTKPPRPIRVYIDSKPVNLTLPILVSNGRTLYPFRELLEYIGAEVSYDAAAKTAIVEYNGTVLKFPWDSRTYYVNGSAASMDAETILDSASGRTYIPIRYAFEALGYDVMYIPCQKWDEIRISKLGDYSLMSGDEFLDKYYNFDHTSIFYYDFDTANHRLVFKNDYIPQKYDNLVVSDKLNPDINRQMYDLSKVLADDKNYVYWEYVPALGGGSSYIYCKFAMTQANALMGVEYFALNFSDTEADNLRDSWYGHNISNGKLFSNNSVITLGLGSLWTDADLEAGYWSTPFFEKKLRDSLIALFGQDEGKKVYEYVYNWYITVHAADRDKYKNFGNSKKIGNIEVDFYTENGGELYFDFSYVK